jgi:hypothetical protein
MPRSLHGDRGVPDSAAEQATQQLTQQLTQRLTEHAARVGCP